MTTYPESTLIFENPELTVRALSVSEMDNSVYLITMRATGEQVLIDPAAEAEELYAFTLDALFRTARSWNSPMPRTAACASWRRKKTLMPSNPAQSA